MDLIDGILPPRRVHLLAGVSDAGKTRFILPLMLDWEQSKPVLGKASHPVPWAYVAGDRSLEEAHDTMTTMGILPTAVRIIPAFGKDHKGTLLEILRAAEELEPTPELLVIEGFSDLVPKPEGKAEVREFLNSASAYCSSPNRTWPNGLTILGVVESPKLKPFERYPNPRQRISGVSSWAYHSSTVFLIEYPQADRDCESDDRTLWICAKNARRMKLKGVTPWPQGRLTF